MAEKTNLLRKVSSLDVSPQFEDYSKIIIHIDDETEIVVGDDTGRTLEYTDPFGTREQAEAQLRKLRGFQYQPAQAEGALLDPAIEVGDGISVKNVYFGMYSRSRKFDRLMKADISAPHDEEIDHEYKYETPQERKFKREIYDVRASLILTNNSIEAEVAERTAMGQQLESRLEIQATEIAAKVSQTGGDNDSFGWSLLADRFSLMSGGREVFRADNKGVQISGRVNITSGTLGQDEQSGFTISSSAIYNNIDHFTVSEGDEDVSGVYIGTNGIRLGNAFRVDSSGNLYAQNGTFNGKVQARNIEYDVATKNTFSGGGITGGSIGTGSGSPLSLTALGGIGGGINFNAATSVNGYNGSIRARNIYATNYLATSNLDATNITWKGNPLSSTIIKDGDGNYVAVITF
ncbi:MAG: hypothetical protein J6S14_02030 [Clostridia bacterium]|nr:hypothetical protein [Clostridia bacterium]